LKRSKTSGTITDFIPSYLIERQSTFTECRTIWPFAGFFQTNVEAPSVPQRHEIAPQRIIVDRSLRLEKIIARRVSCGTRLARGTRSLR
jgi:hypothetical protein